MTFSEHQRVNVVFGDRELVLPGAVIKNIDDTCRPLTNMWLVRLDTGATMGFSGKALEAVH
ncbi:hypothetical protein [Phenylobacterium sp.]|uniref:hypothetical protein n=1 Tax=Phenylobacterium sp. TaxID=1871053 RepID=UPI002615EBC1|nr:hypothetical protein [Phenylobacterium sp.]